MVYIYKKIIGGVSHYYLRVSERKGQRVIAKDIAYLGNSIHDLQKKLDGLKEYKDDIRKAYKTIHKVIESNIWLEKVKDKKQKKDPYLGNLFLEVEACKLHFSTIFKKKNYLTQNTIMKQFAIDFSYNTTSIEGNTIKLNEARKLLEEGLTPKNRTTREIFDVQNTEKVFLENETYDISNASIIKIHKDLMENIDKRIGYRTEDVHVFKSHFDVTPAPYVRTDMDLLIKWYNDNTEKLHPFVLAVLFHHKFEKIHPFMDGNGRTGRMLMNLILLKHNYPPVIIENKLRVEYLGALSKADPAKFSSTEIEKYSLLITFIAKEMIAGYWGLFL
jgi:fido (protein-threonine AMPylation protein)